jgi:hypothetical protein
MIKIGANTIKSSKQDLQFLKAILDKLELPYILDGISFHNINNGNNFVSNY